MFGDRHWWEELDDFGVVSGDLGEDAVFFEEGDDNGLAEDGVVHGVEGIPLLLEEEAGLGAGEVDREHEALAADVGDERAFHGDGLEGVHDVLAHGGGVFDELVVFDDVQGGEGGGHRHVVLAVGVGVDNAAFHGVEDRLHDGFARNDGADGDVTTRQRLGDAEDVGLDAVKVLEGEPFAGATEAALDFVEDEDGAVGFAEALRGAKEFFGDHFAGFALDRFDDEACNVLVGEGLFEGGDVVEGHLDRAGGELAEAFLEEVGAVDGESTAGETVEGVVAVDDFLALGVGAGELESAFDGFSAGVGEEDAFEISAGVFGELLGDEAGEEGAIHSHQVRQILIHHLAEDGADLGVVAAEGEDAPAGEEVEVLVAVLVPEVASLAADVAFVEADGSEHFDEGGIDVFVVEVVLFTGLLGEIAVEVGIDIRHLRYTRP